MKKLILFLSVISIVIIWGGCTSQSVVDENPTEEQEKIESQNFESHRLHSENPVSPLYVGILSKATQQRVRAIEGIGFMPDSAHSLQISQEVLTQATLFDFSSDPSCGIRPAMWLHL